MPVPITFLPRTGRAPLEIEIPDDTEERFRFRAAVEIAVQKDANLDGASLARANLAVADLARADLARANLDHASLDHASLDNIRNDLWDVLLRAQSEVPALLAALREGRIDGSTYEGECACLAGTIANARGVSHHALDFANGGRLIERWFLGISKGSTPATNQIARITEGWIVEFQRLVGQEAA